MDNTEAKRRKTEYLKSYYEKRPEYKEYLRIKELFKKAAFRIRDYELGLRDSLRESDIQLRDVLNEKMVDGMTWHNYHRFWRISYPNLIMSILRGYSKSELLAPDNVIPTLVEKKNV